MKIKKFKKIINNFCLRRSEEVWEGVKKEIETINGGKKVEYGKDF